MKLEALIVPFVADTTDFKAGAQEVERTGKTTAANFGSMIAGAISGAIGAAMLNFSKQSISAASDLQESGNAVNVVFGENASIISAAGENIAQTAGLAKSEFYQMSAVTGALLQNLGYEEEEAANKTVDLAQRAADMASIFNTDVPQALGAIQSALKGEFNPLEAFGVKLNQADIDARALAMGLAESKTELDNNARAQAALALIMEQTDAIAGDFVETSDQLANSQRILEADVENAKAELGEALLPVMLELTTAAKDLTSWFTSLSPETQKWIGYGIAFIGALALIAPLITGIIAVAGALGVTISLPFILIIGLVLALGAYFVWLGGRIAASVDFWKEKLEEGRVAFGEKFEAAKTKILEIMEGIKQGVKDAIDGIKSFFENIFPDIEIPAWLKPFIPGSPTPFEIGIKGIDKALGNLDLRSSLAPAYEPAMSMSMQAQQNQQPIDYERLARAVVHAFTLTGR